MIDNYSVHKIQPYLTNNPTQTQNQTCSKNQTCRALTFTIYILCTFMIQDEPCLHDNPDVSFLPVGRVTFWGGKGVLWPLLKSLVVWSAGVWFSSAKAEGERVPAGGPSFFFLLLLRECGLFFAGGCTVVVGGWFGCGGLCRWASFIKQETDDDGS